MPEAIVPEVGHGPEKGQNGFDRAYVSVVFLFLLCFIAHSYDANGHGSIGLLQARFYFHVNGCIGIVQKIDFEIRPDLGFTTLKTARKVVLDNPSVCLSVCPSVRLSDRLSCCRFSRELSQA